MKSIAQSKPFENEISSTIDVFFRSFRIGTILRKVGAYKSKGIPAVTVFQKLFALVFSHRVLFMELQTGNCPNIAKDTFYRLLNSCNINWMRFTTFLATLIVNDRLMKLTDEKRVNVFNVIVRKQLSC